MQPFLVWFVWYIMSKKIFSVSQEKKKKAKLLIVSLFDLKFTVLVHSHRS